MANRATKQREAEKFWAVQKARSKWRFELEYVSAERKVETGKALLFDQHDIYIGKVDANYARKIVEAVAFYENELEHQGEAI